jgi:hypothetical protein
MPHGQLLLRVNGSWVSEPEQVPSQPSVLPVWNSKNAKTRKRMRFSLLALHRAKTESIVVG